jgi:hypothetical protein
MSLEAAMTCPGYPGACKFVALALACLLAPQRSAAQQNAVAIQLPTFSFFSVRTTVVVPDNGGAYLGGIGRASSGSSVFGTPIFRNGAIGLERSHAGMSVHATIHDFDALDAQLLGQAARTTSGQAARWAARDVIPPLLRRHHDAHASAGAADEPGKQARRAPPHVPSVAADDPGRSSLAQLRQAQQQQAAAEDAEAAAYFERGRRAAESGNFGAARAYFQMAARRATGALRQAALEQLASLGGASVR